MGDEEATEEEERAPTRVDRLAVLAATAAVSVALGGAVLELCYTLFRW